MVTESSLFTQIMELVATQCIFYDTNKLFFKQRFFLLFFIKKNKKNNVLFHNYLNKEIVRNAILRFVFFCTSSIIRKMPQDDVISTIFIKTGL